MVVAGRGGGGDAQARQRGDVRGGQPKRRRDRQADDVRASRRLVGIADVVGACRMLRSGELAGRLVERPGKRLAETEADVLVPRPRDEDDPARMALVDRVQSL
jgi:hypothetical protein